MRKYYRLRFIYSKQVLEPIQIDINLLIDCLFETRNYSMLSQPFIASSFRVTEENLLLETGPPSFLLNVFTALKGTNSDSFIYYIY